MTDPITSHTAIHTTAIHTTAIHTTADTATGPVIDRTRNRSSCVLLAIAVAWVASVVGPRATSMPDSPSPQASVTSPPAWPRSGC